MVQVNVKHVCLHACLMWQDEISDQVFAADLDSCNHHGTLQQSLQGLLKATGMKVSTAGRER
jgi:hypothetical protein